MRLRVAFQVFFRHFAEHWERLSEAIPMRQCTFTGKFALRDCINKGELQRENTDLLQLLIDLLVGIKLLV
jgi:hypothetical protein